jgi:tRNA threonylcarbamoyladenosine biosynthesis protein TsaB
VRVLGIESTSRRGSVALVQGGETVASTTYEAEKAHAERLLPEVEALLERAGWGRRDLERVAVGVGPGSFTGLRVGIALAQGIALGLGIPAVGVGSLRAMCLAVPADLPGPRCALIDARRADVFAAIYSAGGDELAAAQVVRRADLEEWLSRVGPIVVVGEPLDQLGPVAGAYRSEFTDLAHAEAVARAGAALDPDTHPAEPLYVKEADAIRPNLPRSPLSSDPPK